MAEPTGNASQLCGFAVPPSLALQGHMKAALEPEATGLHGKSGWAFLSGVKCWRVNERKGHEFIGLICARAMLMHAQTHDVRAPDCD